MARDDEREERDRGERGDRKEKKDLSLQWGLGTPYHLFDKIRLRNSHEFIILCLLDFRNQFVLVMEVCHVSCCQ